MKAKISVLLAAVVLAMGLFASVASADGNGQAIGQDPEALAETRCANAGAGNGGEVLLGDEDDDELECVKQQGKEVAFKDRDPGNSHDHNNAPPIPPGTP